MKKLIAAALAILLGSTGYVIVDHTLEDRVTVLEEQAQSMSGDISSLNDKIKNFNVTTEKTSTTKALLKIKLPDNLDKDKLYKFYCYQSNGYSLIPFIVFPSEPYTSITVSAALGEKYQFSVYIESALYCTCDIENQNGTIYVSNIEYREIEEESLTTTTTTLPNVVIK